MTPTKTVSSAKITTDTARYDITLTRQQDAPDELAVIINLAFTAPAPDGQPLTAYNYSGNANVTVGKLRISLTDTAALPAVADDLHQIITQLL